MKISDKDRVALIRKGNQLFNEGKIDLAAKIFEAVNYKDGLIRIGDYYYERNQPLIALKYYTKARYKPRIDEIMEKVVVALNQWLKEK